MKTALAICTHTECWANVDLLKDCGLIPYLLHKNHGMEVRMLGGTPAGLRDFAHGAEGDVFSNAELEKDPAYREKYRLLYPYASLVPGIELLFLRDASQEAFLKYLDSYAEKYDLLILYGAHESNIAPALYYKYRNPKGKIYCGLDVNSRWADRILWYKEPFPSFMAAVDFKAVSCTGILRYLQKKWPWEIRMNPNGSYCFDPVYKSEVPFQDRDNAILSVSRLGTYQKATGILLQAFMKIADQIPGWTLRLVGSVEPEFQALFDKVKRVPSMANRIFLLGTITDKGRLMEEYRHAKIFALPSRMEGGTPNAAADALYQGLVMAVTEVDAYEDMICGGEAGLSAPIDDVDAFAQILLRLCTDPALREKSERAYRLGREFYDMEKIVASLYEALRDL